MLPFAGSAVNWPGRRPAHPAAGAPVRPAGGPAEWQNVLPRSPPEGLPAMADRAEIIDQIAGFGLFADLPTPRLERIVHMLEEQWYGEGERVLRQGLSGSRFHVILDGEATVVIDGQPRATLGRGDFFGELSILLGEPPVADVVAVRGLRCLVLPGGDLQAFLNENPSVMYRMLQVEARRLRTANRWQS